MGLVRQAAVESGVDDPRADQAGEERGLAERRRREAMASRRQSPPGPGRVYCPMANSVSPPRYSSTLRINRSRSIPKLRWTRRSGSADNARMPDANEIPDGKLQILVLERRDSRLNMVARFYVRASWPAIVQRNADFGPYARTGGVADLSSSRLKGKITSRR